ncbi:MAG: hypothetical protein AAF383_15400 [Cyanobacteria bacterium P01_A01_bin.83]
MLSTSANYPEKKVDKQPKTFLQTKVTKENIIPKYMTQKMSYGTHQAITYYRKQKNDHPNHSETGAFTTAAKQNYANSNNLKVSEVEAGKYHSGQGVPTGGTTRKI